MTTETTKHTPIPWILEVDGTLHKIFSKSSSQAVLKWRKDNPDKRQDTFNEVKICDISVHYNGSGDEFGPDISLDIDEARANAEIIVKAVNCHDDLVEALAQCYNTLKTIIRKGGIPDYIAEHVSEMVEKAIAKAERE